MEQYRSKRIFVALRPLMLNGISGVETRPDLLDRAIVLNLPIISELKRREEDELWKFLSFAADAAGVGCWITSALKHVDDGISASHD